eukprot:4105309-Amphidinium_carterae.1
MGLRGRVFVAPREAPQGVDLLQQLKTMEDERCFASAGAMNDVRRATPWKLLRALQSFTRTTTSIWETS